MRITGSCKHCLHKFAFTGAFIITDKNVSAPQYNGNALITDTLFQKAIDVTGGLGKFTFTGRQLYYEFMRRLPTPSTTGCTPAVGVLAMMPALLLLGAMGVAGNTGSTSPGATGPPMSFNTFLYRYLNRWIHVHGEITGLVDANEQTKMATPVLPELLNYSFDRCLIVDNADIAAMLVGNRFHFENNCAILSLDCLYPNKERRDAVMLMLDKNPDLTVAYLHDASAAAFSAKDTLRSANWFGDRRIWVADIGMTPRQAWKQKLFVEQTAPVGATATLPKDEFDWLNQGYYCSLSCLRPAQLLKVAYMGLTEASRMTHSDAFDDTSGYFIMGYAYGGYGYGYVYESAMYDPWMSGMDTATFDATAPDSFG